MLGSIINVLNLLGFILFGKFDILNSSVNSVYRSDSRNWPNSAPTGRLDDSDPTA